MSKCVIPISGGVDSTVILNWAVSQGKQPHTITFNYGQRHHSKETQCAIATCEHLDIPYMELDMSFIKKIVTSSSLTNDNIDVAKTRDVLGDPQTVNYVPNRNMIMLSVATAYAESIKADQVYHGAALVDSQAGFWDGSIEFLTAINKVNELNRRDRVEILAPLIDKSKKDIIELGVDVGVDFSKTWTCYEGDHQACGECTACSSRIKGFLDAGYVDPIDYKIDIPWAKYNCKPIK